MAVERDLLSGVSTLFIFPVVRRSQPKDLPTRVVKPVSPIVQSQESHATMPKFHVCICKQQINLQTKEKNTSPFTRPHSSVRNHPHARESAIPYARHACLKACINHHPVALCRLAKPSILPETVKEAAQERAQAFSAPRGSPWGRLEGWKG